MAYEIRRAEYFYASVEGEQVEAFQLLNALADLGFEGVADTRVGRLIRLDLDIDDAAKAELQVREMCEKLLANPVIEQYEIVIEDEEPI